jgi:hypothetical protein
MKGIKIKTDEADFVRFRSLHLFLTSWAAIAPAPASTAVTAATTIAATSTAISTTPTAWTAAATTRFTLIFLARLFGGPAFEHGLAGEPDLALWVDVGHHDGDLIAHIDNILHFVDALGIQLRDVNESIHAGQDLDERAKVRDTHDFASVDVPDNSVFAQRLDAFLPINAPILSTGIFTVIIRGAWGFSSARDSGSTASIFSMIDMRATWACSNASFITCALKPLILMSICSAVMPAAVPATLKSISPR